MKYLSLMILGMMLSSQASFAQLKVEGKKTGALQPKINGLYSNGCSTIESCWRANGTKLHCGACSAEEANGSDCSTHFN